MCACAPDSHKHMIIVFKYYPFLKSEIEHTATSLYELSEQSSLGTDGVTTNPKFFYRV